MRNVAILRMLVLLPLLAAAGCQSSNKSARAPGSTARSEHAGVHDVRAYGAKGDGKALDTPAINRAIDAAASRGGGTVFFPGGDYLSVSIRLKSNVALYLNQGATI